jgi:hypothetical protein
VQPASSSQEAARRRALITSNLSFYKGSNIFHSAAGEPEIYMYETPISNTVTSRQAILRSNSRGSEIESTSLSRSAIEGGILMRPTSEEEMSSPRSRTLSHHRIGEFHPHLGMGFDLGTYDASLPLARAVTSRWVRLDALSMNSTARRELAAAANYQARTLSSIKTKRAREDSFHTK